MAYNTDYYSYAPNQVHGQTGQSYSNSDLGVPLDQVTPFDGEPLPQGEYLVMVTRSELRYSQNKNENYLSLAYRVQDGEHQGRVLAENLWLYSEKNGVALSRLKALRKALHLDCKVGGTTGELLGKLLVVTVSVVPKWGVANAWENQITRYEAAAQQAPVQQTQQPQPAPAQQAAQQAAQQVQPAQQTMRAYQPQPSEAMDQVPF